MHRRTKTICDMSVWKLVKFWKERQFNMAVTDKQEGSLQWCERFEGGHTNTVNDACSRQPSTVMCWG